ncbi:MAG: hypothetical protein WA824_01430, partial [Candidatus Sulfotelmatobacter sp.]
MRTLQWRIGKWVLAVASLLSISAAQQPQQSQLTAQPVPAATTAAADANASTAQSPNTLPQASPEPPPVTMDQVVDRVIEREHGLIKFLSNRTPVVETYLQNLRPDPLLGAVPSEDHYFLGRMDMGEVIDRKDYLKDEDRSMQSRLLGGFHKLFTVQYQPMGFAWMVYA